MAKLMTQKLLEQLQQIGSIGDEVRLDGNSLTAPLVLTAANTPGIKVTIDEQIQANLKENHAFLRKKVEDGCMIYGVNTGFGGSADVRSDDTAEIQRALVHHLNGGFGRKLDSKVVRGLMMVRANSLSKGFSGVRPEVVSCLCRMIEEDIIPVVPLRGSISASGDLMPTSYVAACMMGRPDAKVIHRGTEKTMEEVIKEGFEPLSFKEKEALAVVNAASVASTMSACILPDVSSALLFTQLSTAMTAEALRGRLESFHPTIHKCLPHKGQQEAAANISRLLAQSKLVESRMDIDTEDHAGALKQDRYALRTAAQWLSPTLESVVRALDTVKIDLNSANDNPLFNHHDQEILHGGNFQGVSATVAMDQTRQALQLCGKLLFAQMSEMLNFKMSNGLSPNLCGSNPNVDFGLKGTDTAMASYMSELDYLTGPLTNHVLSAEMHNQSVNSLALVSARMTAQALEILQMMQANITLSHVQAIDLRVLQMKVEAKLMEITKGNNVPSKLLTTDIFPWYKFVFLPRKTTEEYMHFIEVNGNRMATVTSEVEAAMEELLSYFREGKQIDEVSQYLGKGTCSLYRFVRKELGVEFCDGKRYIDNMLHKIHEAIKNRRFNPLIQEAFE